MLKALFLTNHAFSKVISVAPFSRVINKVVYGWMPLVSNNYDISIILSAKPIGSWFCGIFKFKDNNIVGTYYTAK